MKKEFIPYEQALELKEIDFNEPCCGYRREDGVFEFFGTPDRDNTNSIFGYYPTSPTFSQAFRWFREKGYFTQIYPDNSQFVNEAKEWFYSIKNGSITTNDEKYYSYEEAELECLKKLIEIVKNK